MNGAIRDLDGNVVGGFLAALTANSALDRMEGRYAGPNTKPGISVVAFGTSPTWNNKL